MAFFRHVVLNVTAALALLLPVAVRAHSLNFTRVEVMFAQPGRVDITVAFNLAMVLPRADGYYELTTSSAAVQQAEMARALPEILEALQLEAGDARLKLEFQGFTLPKLSAEAFADMTVDKSAILRFTAKLPDKPAPLVLFVPTGSPVDHPVMFAAGSPKTGIVFRSWIDDGWGASEPFDWTPFAGGVARAPIAVMPATPWYREIATYLRLGFKHIVPQGADHILFVLALFFLGLTWRKLIAQTTVFTVAHATTLFLSRYGYISLPGRIVEPLIAFSIACIALENIYRPKLGPARLALVFTFGLVHGLGFASSLNEVQFPKNQFLVALLGFNFGVDFGQLFVIALAFLAVGWFRDKPWFRSRITVPCCLVIAAIGLGWTVQRIFF